MANICSNVLTLNHPFTEEQVNRLKTKLYDADGVFCFDVMVPVPQHQPDKIRENYFNHYDSLSQWYVTNWGTKSSPYYVTDTIKSGLDTLYFSTSWSAPDGWFKALCEEFKDISMSLYYLEEGCELSGVMENNDGEVYHYNLEYSENLLYVECEDEDEEDYESDDDE